MPNPTLEIAIVDDEECVRKALGRLLRAAGFAVETFASGREFLDSLEAHRPHCTILDVQLPGLSGLEVQRQLASETDPLPCVVITGKDEAGVRECALAAGAVAYLKKPVDEQSLLAAITSAVSVPIAESPEQPKSEPVRAVSNVRSGDEINS